VTVNAIPTVVAPDDVAEAYVDVDWIRGAGNAPCLYVRDGRLFASWLDGDGVAVGNGSSVEAAGGVLQLMSRRAVSAVADVTGWVDVVGDGAVALLVRGALPAKQHAGSGPPAAVIDCSGERSAVEDAAQRVEELGTVVVAGAPGDESLTIDLYPGVHVRGLRLVAISVDLEGEASLDRGMLSDDLRTTLREAGEPTGKEGSTWLRLRPAGDRRQS